MSILTRTAALGLALLAVWGPGIDQEQLECEEAVQHLHECCPKLHAPDACSGEGCGSDALTLAESDCIRALDCAAILEADICGRVERFSDAASPWDDDYYEGPVCP